MATHTTCKPVFIAALLLAAFVAPARADLPITNLLSFNGLTYGGYPCGGLTLSADGSTFYGTTDRGGTHNFGTVFSIPVSGGTRTVLASFSGINGSEPVVNLTLSPDGNTLYGTTLHGGPDYDGTYPSGSGTIFSLPVTGGTPTVLASLNGSPLSNPHAGLTLSGNTLYGTTLHNGGGVGAGTIFSIPVAGGTPTVLASFNGANGQFPNGGLTLSGNTLYGTTANGGDYGYGTVFSVPIAGNTVTVLTSFNGSNGSHPEAALTLSGDETTLYGTTWQGGASNCGTVFSIPLTGGIPTVLDSLNGANGMRSQTALLLSPDGTRLYGTATQGGAHQCGSVFSVPTTGGVLTALASFGGTDGQFPQGDLALIGNTLYGSTTYGGGGYSGYPTTFSGWGTIFSIPIPEPASLILLTLGTSALLLRRHPRKR